MKLFNFLSRLEGLYFLPQKEKKWTSSFWNKMKIRETYDHFDVNFSWQLVGLLLDLGLCILYVSWVEVDMLYKIDKYRKHFSLLSAYFVGLVKGSIYRDLNTLLLHCLLSSSSHNLLPGFNSYSWRTANQGSRR